MHEVNSIQSCMDSYNNKDLHAQTPSNIQVHRTKKNKILQGFKASSNLIKKFKITSKNKSSDWNTAFFKTAITSVNICPNIGSLVNNQLFT